MKVEFLIFFIVLSKAFAQDSCGPCSTHIACQNQNPTKCSSVEIPLSESDKKDILNFHNLIRNEVSQGDAKGLSTAARMGQMVSTSIHL